MEHSKFQNNMTIQEIAQEYPEVRNHFGITLLQLSNCFSGWFEDYRKGGEKYQDNLKGMTENNMSEVDVIPILGYTGSWSSWINSELRNGGNITIEAKSMFIQALNTSLDKVCSVKGDTVYRMDSPSGDTGQILDWFSKNIGKVINIPYFLSTSKDDYKNTPIAWVISTLEENSKGKDISHISNNKYENEVLFQPDSKFIINEVKDNYIYMTEILSTNNSDINLVGLYFHK